MRIDRPLGIHVEDHRRKRPDPAHVEPFRQRGQRAGVAEGIDQEFIDIDDKALVASRDNATRNGVALDVQHSAQTLDEQFDVVVANILTNPLCVLAPLIAARVAPGGHLALAGVLENQAEQVIAAYAPYIALRAGAVREGWVRLEGQQPA